MGIPMSKQHNVNLKTWKVIHVCIDWSVFSEAKSFSLS